MENKRIMLLAETGVAVPCQLSMVNLYRMPSGRLDQSGDAAYTDPWQCVGAGFPE